MRKIITKEKKEIKQQYNTHAIPVDEKEVARVVAMTRASFKTTPPKLSAEKHQYDWFNKILSEVNFDSVFDGLDIARTIYEAMFPMFQQLWDDREEDRVELEKFKTPMMDLYLHLKNVKFNNKNEDPIKCIGRFIKTIEANNE